MSFFGFLKDLATSVGDRMPNRDEDVRSVKGALHELGHFDFGTEPEPHGYVTRQFDDSIKKYQSERGLKIDGILHPGGETQRSLVQDIGRKRSQDSLSWMTGGFSSDLPHPLESARSSSAIPRYNLGTIAGRFGDFLRTAAETRQEEDHAVLRQYIRAKNAQSKTSQPEKPEPFGLPTPEKKSGHTIDTFLPSLLTEEGGYTPGKYDRRGPTNIGVNKKTLEEYEAYKRNRNEPIPPSFTKDITKVTPELARQIYDENYYKKYNIDKIANKKIAGHLLDIAINTGPHQSGQWIQEELNKKMGYNLKVDGTIGSQTRKAIEEADRKGVLEEINNKIVERRKDYYREIVIKNPTQKGFLKNWLERSERFKTTQNRD